MASEEQNNDDESVKGFAGLSSMVSDVDDITTSEETGNSEPPTEVASTAQTKHQPTSEPESRTDSWRQAQQPPNDSSGIFPGVRSVILAIQTQQPPNDSSGIFWLIAICAVIFCIWLGSESGNNSNKPTPTSYSSSSAVDSPTHSLERSELAPTQPLIPIRPSEEKPPVGTSLNLGSAQIRYCLAEDIRIKGAEGGLNNRIESDVDRFNAIVTDYNSRCGHFSYRSGALESAKSEIERYRAVLESEGQARFTRIASISPQQILTTPALSQPSQGFANTSSDGFANISSDGFANSTSGSFLNSDAGSFLNSEANPSLLESKQQQVAAISDAKKQFLMVLDLQKRLNELGYDVGKVDGLAGGKTRVAIMAVQRVLGIQVNGIASVNLLKRLDSVSQKSNAKIAVKSTPPLDEIIAPTIQPRSSRISQLELPIASTEHLEPRKTTLGYDLNDLSTKEQESIESACSSDKVLNGPAAYNKCLSRQLSALTPNNRRPDLSGLSTKEQESIESACSSDKVLNGPAAYNKCLSRQISLLRK